MMRPTSLSAAVTAATLAWSVSATTTPRFDLLFSTFPNCWKDALKNTDPGCSSSKCICDVSQSNTYLPSVVSLILQNCKDKKDLGLRLLFYVEAYCDLVRDPIPDDVLKSARAATATRTSTTATLTTRKVEDKPKSSGNSRVTTKQNEVDITEEYTKMHTYTSTDKDGNTLQIEVPLFIGPSSWSTGEPFTTTLDKQTSATPSASSSPAVASPSPTPEASPTPSNTQQQPAVSSTPTTRPSQRVSNSNGSPFEDTKAAASRWCVSGSAIGLGVASGLLMMLY